MTKQDLENDESLEFADREVHMSLPVEVLREKFGEDFKEY